MMIKTGVDKILKEINLLKLLKHENVLTLHEIINDDSNDKLYLSKFKLSKFWIYVRKAIWWVGMQTQKPSSLILETNTSQNQKLEAC